MSNSGAREMTQSKNKCLLCRQGLLGTQNCIQVKAGWDVAITSVLGLVWSQASLPSTPASQTSQMGGFQVRLITG